MKDKEKKDYNERIDETIESLKQMKYKLRLNEGYLPNGSISWKEAGEILQNIPGSEDFVGSFEEEDDYILFKLFISNEKFDWSNWKQLLIPRI